MKYIFRHLSIMIILLIITGLIPFVPALTAPVSATVGYISVNITASGYYYYDSVAQVTFGELVSYTTCQAVSPSTYDTAWEAGTQTNKYNLLVRQDYRFDLSGIPAGVQIVSASIWSEYYRNNNSYWLDDYMYLMDDHPSVATLSVNEFHLAKTINTPYTAPFAYVDIPNDQANAIWVKHNVFADQLQKLLTPDSGNYTFIQLMSHYDRYNINGNWYNSQTHIVTTKSVPKLELRYATPPAARTTNILPNDPVYTVPILGTENVTGVSWLSPRAAFSDETIGFRIEGNPGAAFSYQITSGNGDLVLSSNDTIRTNNYYYEYYMPAVTFNDWIKMTVMDIHNNIVSSTWGRVELPPNINQTNLTVSATNTEYPQYDYVFNKYIIYKNGIGIMYWQTNLEAGDMADYSLMLRAGGDNSSISWNSTMQALNTDYYQTVDNYNYFMAHWRYIMFTPYISTTGFNTRDGFIINAAKDYSLDQTGFWQGSIRNDNDSSILTWTESAYFYLNNTNQGVGISLDSSNVKLGAQMTATITIGEHSKIATRLKYVAITLFDSIGLVLGSGSGFVSVGTNTVTFTAPSTAGDYQARFAFYDSTLVPDYQYIHDIPFTVLIGDGTIPPGTPPSPGAIGDWLDALLARWGLNNTGGHWIVIIVLCVLVAAIFGIFGKMPLVATVIDILIFGLALYIKWVDPWITALLAIAAGFTIYRLFKKNTGEQKEV